MKVFVTEEEYAWLSEAMIRAEISGDPADVDHIIGQLCVFALKNGCDNFHPASARVVPTEIEIIKAPCARKPLDIAYSRE